MKRLTAIWALVLIAHTALGQHCIISGQVKGTTSPEVTLRLLNADGHYQFQNQTFSIAANGAFTQTVSLRRPLFAFLTCNNVRYRLLLSPGRNVHILLDPGAGVPISFSGKGAAENQLLQELELEQLAFFMRDHEKINPYAKLSTDSFQLAVVQPVKTILDKKQAQIARSAVPAAIKRLLQREAGYYAQSNLYDLAYGPLHDARNPDREIITQQVMEWLPVPDSAALVSGFYANMVLYEQIRYAVNQMGKDFNQNAEVAKARIGSSLKVPFDDITQLVGRYGERYVLDWLYGKQYLSPDIQGKVLFNRIIGACDASDLNAARYLRDTLLTYFPHGAYTSEAMEAIDQQNKTYEDAIHNRHIVFHDTVKPASLRDLLARYKGKPVYLDIWGTWCGPCRIELGYAGNLKKAFPAGGPVFVYVAMDPDSKEDTWKQMVRIKGIEGEHYRLTSDQIRPLWDEIRAAGGNTDRYPTFVLVNRDGKIVHPNAKFPSEGEETIRQIRSVVSQ